MASQKRRDTGAELLLRRALHAQGLRYRIHQRPLPELRREADVVFRRARVAIFVDGCFWHGCPRHATWPATNAEFWRTKIERNVARDRDTDQLLRAAGWTPIRVWEHESPQDALRRVEAVLRVS
ncbi:very short patch repair endonuclease [Acidothermaceae bacterium B102]|nr:very short patch repair endonuclease [Acidothermaceae bacterium B102]